MLDTALINRWPIKDDPPEGTTSATCVVEVHMTNGGSAWVLADGADLAHVEAGMRARRLLCGRLVGGADVNGRGVLIPVARIQMVMDVDG